MLNRRQFIAAGTGMALASAFTRSTAQEAAQLQVNSTRYIATNAETGAIFAQKNARERVAIASLTKIFTAVQAIAMAPLDYEITTTEDDLQSTEATVMGFAPGMTYTLEELIYGMMLPSGNDAAHAISRSLGYKEGDTAEEATKRFMDKVNQRALDMGLQDTHLLNPDGWGVPGHYSTAADVAAFMAYACQNEFLLTVMGTRRYTTERGSTLVNTNKVLGTAPSVLGGKTGYDWDSGWCLVQIAERSNTRIIAVTLDGVAPDDWYNDNLTLLDFGFNEQQALGNREFAGESVTWQNPEPALFMQAGPAEASITGESEGGEHIVTRQETEQADVPEHETSANRGGSGQPVPRSSSLLAGLAGIGTAAGMAYSRWQSAGGDGTSATILPSLRALGTSGKHMLPTFTSLPKPKVERRETPEERFDDEPFDQHIAPEEYYEQPIEESDANDHSDSSLPPVDDFYPGGQDPETSGVFERSDRRDDSLKP